ncbi:Lar family restriction alleviation protein [Porcipelethomonas sp.]|uniref:Lar family restriction alleviation protein n=1 Tax=Porcipelethomonas sp. TaxID=2981675 RepID=UPI003079A766
MNEKLKPCPFCGKKPGLETWCSGGKMYMIKCKNADCPVPEKGYPTGRIPEQVAEAWNRRAENAEV